MIEKGYWIMKSEPMNYSILDLKKEKRTLWDGVRNYQARNFMMKNMKIGDEVLFYHSNANPSGVVGLASVFKEALLDPTALDKKSKYYDPKASIKNPRWFGVTVQFKEAFKNIISLQNLHKEPILKNMLLLKKGQRLSVLPVTKKEYQHILKLAKV